MPTQSQQLGRVSRNRHRHKELTLDILKRSGAIHGPVSHHFRQVEAACNVSGSQLWLLHELQLAPTKRAAKALTEAPGPADGLIPEVLMNLAETPLESLMANLGDPIKGLYLLDHQVAERPLADL